MATDNLCPVCLDSVASEPPNYLAECGKVIHEKCHDDMIEYDGATKCWCSSGQNHKYAQIAAESVCGKCEASSRYVNIVTYEISCGCNPAITSNRQTAAMFIDETVRIVFKAKHRELAATHAAQYSFVVALLPYTKTNEEKDEIIAALKALDIAEDDLRMLVPLPRDAKLEFHVNRFKYVHSLNVQPKLEIGWRLMYIIHKNGIVKPDSCFCSAMDEMIIQMCKDGVYWTEIGALIHRDPERTITKKLLDYPGLGILKGVTGHYQAIVNKVTGKKIEGAVVSNPPLSKNQTLYDNSVRSRGNPFHLLVRGDGPQFPAIENNNKVIWGGVNPIDNYRPGYYAPDGWHDQAKPSLSGFSDVSPINKKFKSDNKSSENEFTVFPC